MSGARWELDNKKCQKYNNCVNNAILVLAVYILDVFVKARSLMTGVGQDGKI
jgi:hypothetical protein